MLIPIIKLDEGRFLVDNLYRDITFVSFDIFLMYKLYYNC
jgi:hypothetical protein